MHTAPGRSVTLHRAGEHLKLDHERPLALERGDDDAAGDAVTLVARGPGFAVSSEGVAMTPGLEGQPTQVRLDNGRMVQGIAVGNRRVEVNL